MCRGRGQLNLPEASAWTPCQDGPEASDFWQLPSRGQGCSPLPGHLLPAAPVGTGMAQQHGRGRGTQQTRWARSEPASCGWPRTHPLPRPRALSQALARPTPLSVSSWARALLSAPSCRPHTPSLTSLW